MRTEDGKIIEKCLNGEPEAFGLLVDKYRASIYALIYTKVQNFHDAQDITQDVFLEAYRDLRKLRHRDSFVWWLYSIAYNDCKNWFRDQSKRPDSSFIEDQEQEKLESPSIDAYHEDLINESLRDTLNSLPEKYREVLTLYYLGGMDSEEIARIIGVSPTAVRQRLSRARVQLKEEVLGMISETFSQQRLPVTFTFRIVEAVKRIKIHPTSTIKGLPWGLSLATGVIITVLSLNPYLSWFSQIGDYARSVLPSETKVLKVGEIPVDIVKTSNISILSNNMGKGKGGEPKQPDENAFFMAPQGEGGTWIKKADMPTARVDKSSAVAGGKIYVIGGQAFNTAPGLSIVEEYNPATDTWTKKTDMPTARAGLSSVAVKGKIYTIGGIKCDFNSTGLPTVEEYDPVTDKWTKKADMPTPRWGLSASVVNGKIYAIGGDLGDQGVLPTATVEEYNPENDTWTKKADMPTPRLYCPASVVNGKIYIIGGTSNLGRNKFSTVEEYDPATDSWTKKADMPTSRCWHCTCASGGRIYAFGGFIDLVGLTIVEEYNPETNTWKKVADMPTGRQLLTAGEVNGKIYVIGGAIGKFRNVNWNDPEWKGLPIIEEYTPDGWSSGQSVVSPQGKLPSKWGKLKSR